MSSLSLFFLSFFTGLATVVLVTLTTRVSRENRYFDGLGEDALWRFCFFFLPLHSDPISRDGRVGNPACGVFIS